MPTSTLCPSSVGVVSRVGGVMARFTGLLLAILVLAGIPLLTSGCGNGTPPPRTLQSISVNPASADAQNFSNGQVQFSALGNYIQPPSPSAITPSGWSLSDPNMATISQSGLAACKSGASGVVTVTASACCAPCMGTGCTSALLLGTAQLSCP